MATKQTEYVVTANRLRDGRVVYLASGPRWSESYAEGHGTSDTAERDRLLAWGRSRELEVCGVYAIEATLDVRGQRELSARERLRALGPEDARKRLGYAERGTG
jgi:hypothetical protein